MLQDKDASPATTNDSLPPPESATADPFTEIVSLARRASSRSRFMSDMLRCVARYFRSPYAAVHLRYASEVIQDDCHIGPTDPNFWKASLQQFLTESLTEVRSRAKVLRAKSSHTRVAFFSAPVFDPSGPAIGAVALVVAPIDDADVTTSLARLESLSRVASLSVELLESARGGVGASKASAQAQARAALCGTVEELAFAITNELRNKLGGEQVSLGMVSRNRVKIISISGLDEVKKQSPGVVSLLEAMEECYDAGASIVYQRDGGWSSDGARSGYRLHKQWHAAAKGDAVASIPLRTSSKIVAILSIRRRADQPFTSDQVEQIRTRVEPFASALLLTRRANRGLVRHLTDSLDAMVDGLRTPGRVGRKAAAVAAALGVLWFAFGSMDYELAVPAVVTAAEIRHVSAPMNGVLASASVIEGDHVSQGDILCQFDDRDFDQQRAQLLAELTVLERVMDRARADESPFDAQLARAQQELARTKLDIVDRRIQQATLTAPIDGVIVAGDLRKHIGSVLTRGDPLFQIAPLDRWTLELQVPEASSDDLAADLVGSFAGFARPEAIRNFRISRVLAASEVRGTRNVYIAEADIDARGDWMRPGMEGIAKIQVGTRPVRWVALHRVIDYLRIHLWL